MDALKNCYTFPAGFKHPSWPIVIKFHVKHHQVTGKAGYAFWADWIETLETKNTYRLIIVETCFKYQRFFLINCFPNCYSAQVS